MLKKAILLITVTLTSFNIFGQNNIINYSDPKEYCVKEVDISGVKYLDKSVLLHIIGINVGDTIVIPSEKLTKAIEKLWSQGLFSDVRFSASKIIGDDLYLNIFLQERPRLSKLSIEGIKRSETETLLEKINMRNGSQVTDNVLNNAVNTIKSHYKEKGFYNTDVQVIKQDDTLRTNNVLVKFIVDKNEKVKIEDIYFDGIEEVAENKLLKSMKETKEKRWWRFWKPSKFVQEKYEEDQVNLIKKFNEFGYRDAKIITDSIYMEDSKNMKLVIKVEEGKKYFFRDINWIGNSKYPDEILGSILNIYEGDIYDKELLNNRLFVDDDAVSNLYLNNGYLFFSVTPVEVNIDGDSIDLEMRMYEGEQAYINNVIISGNTKTHDHVVRRELRTKPGELFSKDDIIRSVREIANLGHFNPENIEPVPIPNANDGTVDIRYNLEERANDQLEISGGWGAGMLVGTIGLRFSNFAIRNFFDKDEWRPVPSGDGQSLSLRAQTNGNYYQAYNVSFVEPWFGGKKPNSFSISTYLTKQTSYSYTDTQTDDETGETVYATVQPTLKITGFSIGLGRRLKFPDDFFTLYNDISIQQYKLQDWNTYFLFSNGSSNNFSFKTVLSRNNTSQIIYPRNGSSFTLGVQITPPYSLFSKKDFSDPEMSDADKYHWIEYHKWTYKGTWYLQLVGDLVLSTNTQFGYLGHYNDDIGPSPFEGFDVGGDGMSGYSFYGRETIALRGYENSSLTPQVFSNGSYRSSGNVYNKYTMELRYPITLTPSASIYAHTFLEAGNAWYSIKEFNPFDIKRSAGIGLRAFLPMLGMLGIDWAYGFDNVYDVNGNIKEDASGGQIHFTLGQQF